MCACVYVYILVLEDVIGSDVGGRFLLAHPVHIWKFSMKFGHLILRKIITFVVIRCQILRLKCTNIDFGWGSSPDPAGGAYNASQTP